MEILWKAIGVVGGIAAAFVGAEAYKRFTTPKQKKKWEGFVKTHHGEVGAIIAAAGVGLMLHDRKDLKGRFS